MHQPQRQNQKFHATGACRREPRLDRRVLNMEFKGGKKSQPQTRLPAPAALGGVPTAKDGSEAGRGWPRAAAGSGEERGAGEAMEFGGNTGSGTPRAGTEEGAGSEQGGSAQGATGKEVTRVPTVPQRWQRMSQWTQGTPNSTPAPLGHPSRLALVRPGAGALGEPLAPVRTATCQSHFLKQPTTGGGTATRGHPAPDRALPLPPNSGRAPRARAPKAPRVHGRGFQPQAPSGGCTPSVNPESTPRSHPELTARACRGYTPGEHPKHAP